MHELMLGDTDFRYPPLERENCVCESCGCGYPTGRGERLATPSAQSQYNVM